MVRLREVPRTATFAWSTGASSPLLATGTRAGAVDADFSNDTTLEIWDLELDSPGQGIELQPAGSINADSRFHDIAWSHATDDHPRGIIAGALENGALDLWDAEKLRNGGSDSFISRTEKHSGAIKAIQFNKFRSGILATSGAKGELYINDLNNPDGAYRLGASAARADDFDALDWNKKVPHILATGSSGGFVTVWDLKTKKENLTLNNYGRKAVSAVAWNPEVPTKLATAIPNDQDPLILMWDLRNSNAPERILKGHDQGVLSLSWCEQDNELLLSCGKDNRTICWNPLTGEMLGEAPVVTNWTFQTRFHPHNPNLWATASFDGKIGIQSIQSTRSDADQSDTAASQPVDGDDFFSRPQAQPQGAAFNITKTPNWLKPPVGVSFGFGGKLIRLGPAEPNSNKSKITISTFAVDSDVGANTEKFEESLAKGDLSSICESKISEAKTDEEKADWTVIETLISDSPRKKLVEYLGFEDQKTDTDSEEKEKTDDKDEGSFFDGPANGDSFLSDLAASKGAKTNNPFKLYSGSESDADKEITRALMMGSFEKALDVCLKEDRLSDAFMIAICGGQKCIAKAQSAYFRQKSDGPNYLRLLASVVGKNLWDMVHNTDLANWKDVMATLCTFADSNEFPDLCEALGDRLEESADDSGAGEARKNATFCYLAGSKLEKVVGNWAQELEENEKEGMKNAESDSSFSVHARYLQNFIEKVTIFREVTNFQDTSAQGESGWKLAPLYTKYTEYADIAAAHGQLKIAEKYLDLLPDKYPAAEVAKSRVKLATRKQTPAQPARAATGATPARGQRVAPSYPGMPGLATQNAPTPSSYAPPGAQPAGQPAPGPYAPSGATRSYTPTQTGAYTPQGYQPGQPQSMMPQPHSYGQPQSMMPPQNFGQPAGGVPPPPRNFSSSPASQRPPPSQANVGSWNDIPDFGNKPSSRRGTPAQNTVSAPFRNPPPQPGPPQASPYGQSTASPPPPPKGPPRMTSPPTGNAYGIQQPERPPSRSTAAYAPPQQAQNLAAGPPQPNIPRGTSPYQPPPSGAPPSNRYAPSPSAQQSAPTGPPGSVAPPPRQLPPPANPYAPQAGGYGQPPAPSPSQQYQPPPGASAPPTGPPPRAGPPPGGPPRGPPPGGPPMGSAPPRPTSTQSQQSNPPPAAAPRHPTGDRSHIPASTQPIYEVLNADMQRVKSRAPPSFMAQVNDTEKRLNILFDHLNNEELQDNMTGPLGQISGALQGQEYEQAQALLTSLMTSSAGEGSKWLVGVKKLIAMSKATPR